MFSAIDITWFENSQQFISHPFEKTEHATDGENKNMYL